MSFLILFFEELLTLKTVNRSAKIVADARTIVLQSILCPDRDALNKFLASYPETFPNRKIPVPVKSVAMAPPYIAFLFFLIKSNIYHLFQHLPTF